jgi:hypothetical protein
MRINPSTRKHYLKTWPEYFEAVRKRKKRFEIRLNDRDYRTGDILILQEFDPNKQAYTGINDITAVVTYTLDKKPFVPDGYIIMSINVMGVEPYGDTQ